MGVIYKNGTYYGGGGGSGGSGAEITIDNELSSTSENPVQNKVIKAELDNKQDADDLMTSADMDDVVTPLPGVASRLPRYSTEEQIVGYWIDGKPLYQKTIIKSDSLSGNILLDSLTNCDDVISVDATALQTDGSIVPIVNAKPSGTNDLYWYYSSSGGGLRMGISASNISKIKLTVKYTKTTD